MNSDSLGNIYRNTSLAFAVLGRLYAGVEKITSVVETPVDQHQLEGWRMKYMAKTVNNRIAHQSGRLIC